MNDHRIDQILIDTDELHRRVRELGREITHAFSGTEALVLVGILRGALYFLADLSRAIDLPVRIDLISVTSYTGTESSGTVTLLKDLDEEIQGKDVLIVEDIVDTGRTLRTLLDHLQGRHPRSLGVCALLDKPDRRIIPVPVDYVGFTIPDHFVVGYGLDYDQSYRNLPHIALLKPSPVTP